MLSSIERQYDPENNISANEHGYVHVTWAEYELYTRLIALSNRVAALEEQNQTKDSNDNPDTIIELTPAQVDDLANGFQVAVEVNGYKVVIITAF
jgi:hypothetical protein